MGSHGFFFKPPIAKARPRKVTSPVIATVRLTGNLIIAETIEVTMANPADGPSLESRLRDVNVHIRIREILFVQTEDGAS